MSQYRVTECKTEEFPAQVAFSQQPAAMGHGRAWQHSHSALQLNNTDLILSTWEAGLTEGKIFILR